MTISRVSKTGPIRITNDLPSSVETKPKVEKPKVRKVTSSKEKALQAYPDLARGLGHRGTFEELPDSAQAAYAQFVTNVISMYKGEKE